MVALFKSHRVKTKEEAALTSLQLEKILDTSLCITKLEKSVQIRMDSLPSLQLSPFLQLVLLHRPKLKANHSRLETISTAK